MKCRIFLNQLTFFVLSVCVCVCVVSAEMWYWVFLWCLFSSLLVHSAVGLLMCVTLQRHKRGRLITLVLISVGFLASLTGGVITSQYSHTSAFLIGQYQHIKSSVHVLENNMNSKLINVHGLFVHDSLTHNFAVVIKSP